MSRKSSRFDGQHVDNVNNDSNRIISLFGSENEAASQSEAICETRDLSSRFGNLKENRKRRLLYPAFGLGLFALLVIGVMGKNGWLPQTDNLSGKRTGWFGRELKSGDARSTGLFSALSPAAAVPASTPQLSKEYVYAGSRLLTVEDAGASAVPPADLAVWRPSNGVWYVLGGVVGSQQTSVQWGSGTTHNDKPVPGDYDGDGKTDFAVYRPNDNGSNSAWYIYTSGGTTFSYSFGLDSDIPTAADFDGDGKTDAAIFRPDTGIWYILRSSDSTLMTTAFGSFGDKPVPKDFDGDGRADAAVWRNETATFHFLRSSKSNNNAAQSIQLGQPGDEPVPADYDGDGEADAAVRRGADWIIRQSSNKQTQTINWGQASDLTVPNDYDGDGKVDIAVWGPANGYWYIRQSQTLTARAVQWGTTGDIPVPAFYRR